MTKKAPTASPSSRFALHHVSSGRWPQGRGAGEGWHPLRGLETRGGGLMASSSFEKSRWNEFLWSTAVGAQGCSFSPFASISTNWAMRPARVSAFLA
jgi:hypothetical protein